MRNLVTFHEPRIVKNEYKKRIYGLNCKKQPEKVILDSATIHDFEHECKKQHYFGIALVSVKNDGVKNSYKLLRVQYLSN